LEDSVRQAVEASGASDRTGSPGRTALRGHVIHDVGGAGPIYAAVTAPGGRRYYSDERHHRIVVEEAGGYRWSFGSLGSGAGELRHPRGLAVLAGPSPDATRLFVCDAWNHRIQVFDGNGRPRFAFGVPGSADGQFDMPSDVCLVAPRFPGEGADDDAVEPWLAVADRWNNRVQVFDLDGALIGVVGGSHGSLARPGADLAGWPFFRLAADPTFGFPVRLSWKAPCLEIESANGHTCRVNLALALLPGFDRWILDAPVAELLSARRAFASAARLALPPADVLAAIATRLGSLQLAAGRPDDAARTWGRSWPRGLTARVIERELTSRVDAAEAGLEGAASRSGRSVISSLESAVAIERRRRGRKAAEHALEGRADIRSRDRATGPTDVERQRADHVLAGLTRLSALGGRLALVRGCRAPEAEVAWTAPAGAGLLQQAVVGPGVLAVVAGQEPAVWLFDARCAPMARFSLPAGTRPRAIAPAPHGGWFVTDLHRDCIIELNDAGKILRLWGGRGEAPDRLCTPLGLWFADCRLYVADRDNDRVQVCEPTGHPLGAYPRLAAPVGVAVDGRVLWVAEWGRPAVRQVDRRTGKTSGWLVHEDLVSPVSVARARGTVLVADHFGAAIHAFDRGGQWLGKLGRAAGQPIGRLTGVAAWAGGGIAVDHEFGRLLRFALPRRTGTWRRE
jgi:hypothetical protein